MSEQDWVRQARAGDRAGVEQLLNAHSTPAYRLALQLVRNPADAEDAVQNALIKAFSHLDRFDDSRPFGPWLLGIVAHEALNLLRAEKSRFAFWQRQATQPESREDDVESLALVRVEHADIWRAANRLQPNDRLVLILTCLMGFSEADAATTMGIKRGTVKSRKHNALLKLRSIIERDFPGLKPEDVALSTSEESRP